MVIIKTSDCWEDVRSKKVFPKFKRCVLLATRLSILENVERDWTERGNKRTIYLKGSRAKILIYYILTFEKPYVKHLKRIVNILT